MKIGQRSQWIWEWERNAFPYYLYLFLIQWRECKFSLPVYVMMIYKNGRANCYLDNKSLNKAARDILNKVEKSSNFLKNWINFEFKTAKELHKFCDKLEKINLKDINDQELLKLYHEAIKKYLDHDIGVAVIRNTNRLLQNELLEIYKKPEIVALLLSTDKKSFMVQEYEDLLKIAEKMRKKIKDDEIERLIETHTKKYFYLPCGFYDEKPFTKKDFLKKLNKILEKKETLKDFRKNLKKEKENRKKIILNLKPSIKTRRLIDFGSYCTYFKDFIRGNLNRLHYLNRKIFKEIGRRTDNKWQDIACLIPPEIDNVLKNKQKIRKRKNALLISDKKGIHFFIGPEAGKQIKKIKRIFTAKIEKEIKGIGVSPGKKRGRVFIIHQIKDIKKSKKDFILVAPMTTPDLMPVVKKAIAIVTDEGGLTCHAAIVSRELKIPCIVGTKIATKVLKDGDLVEVDADQGIVKKL